MVGSIALSCGHTDSVHEHGWPVSTKGFDERGIKAVFHHSLCSRCFAFYLKQDPKRLISSNQQQEDWSTDE